MISFRGKGSERAVDGEGTEKASQEKYHGNRMMKNKSLYMIGKQRGWIMGAGEHLNCSYHCELDSHFSDFNLLFPDEEI